MKVCIAVEEKWSQGGKIYDITVALQTTSQAFHSNFLYIVYHNIDISLVVLEIVCCCAAFLFCNLILSGHHMETKFSRHCWGSNTDIQDGASKPDLISWKIIFFQLLFMFVLWLRLFERQSFSHDGGRC